MLSQDVAKKWKTLTHWPIVNELRKIDTPFYILPLCNKQTNERQPLQQQHIASQFLVQVSVSSGVKIISSVKHFCYLRFYKSLQAQAISVKCDLIKANIHLYTFISSCVSSIRSTILHPKSKFQITVRKTPSTLNIDCFFFYFPNTKSIRLLRRNKYTFPNKQMKCVEIYRIDSLRTVARWHKVLMSSAINGQILHFFWLIFNLKVHVVNLDRISILFTVM